MFAKIEIYQSLIALMGTKSSKEGTAQNAPFNRVSITMNESRCGVVLWGYQDERSEWRNYLDSWKKVEMARLGIIRIRHILESNVSIISDIQPHLFLMNQRESLHECPRCEFIFRGQNSPF